MQKSAEIKQSRSSYSRGFTLLELIVSIGILNIVLGVAYASIAETTRWQRLGVAQRTIALVLQHARFEAIRSHRPVTVTFRAEGFFYDVPGTGKAEDGEFRFTHEQSTKDISWDGVPPPFTFSGLGHVYRNGELINTPIEITLRLRHMFQRIRINSFGSVSMN